MAETTNEAVEKLQTLLRCKYMRDLKVGGVGNLAQTYKAIQGKLLYEACFIAIPMDQRYATFETAAKNILKQGGLKLSVNNLVAKSLGKETNDKPIREFDKEILDKIRKRILDEVYDDFMRVSSNVEDYKKMKISCSKFIDGATVRTACELLKFFDGDIPISRPDFDAYWPRLIKNSDTIRQNQGDRDAIKLIFDESTLSLWRLLLEAEQIVLEDIKKRRQQTQQDALQRKRTRLLEKTAIIERIKNYLSEEVQDLEVLSSKKEGMAFLKNFIQKYQIDRLEEETLEEILEEFVSDFTRKRLVNLRRELESNKANLPLHLSPCELFKLAVSSADLYDYIPGEKIDETIKKWCEEETTKLIESVRRVFAKCSLFALEGEENLMETGIEFDNLMHKILDVYQNEKVVKNLYHWRRPEFEALLRDFIKISKQNIKISKAAASKLDQQNNDDPDSLLKLQEAQDEFSLFRKKKQKDDDFSD